MHDVAAKVVGIAAELEGNKSPVTKLLKTANEDKGEADGHGDEGGLAGRIRAVQKAARRNS
jgi:hypothetical protein